MSGERTDAQSKPFRVSLKDKLPRPSRGRYVLHSQISHGEGSHSDAYRAGDLDAARRLVQRRGRELVRVAYLLTGDGDRAIELATAALLNLLGDPPEEIEYPGRHLALDIARRYLRHPSRSSWLDQPDQSGYQVDDERFRVREALDRLEPPQRAALILSNAAGLPEPDIRNLLGLDSREALQEIHELAWTRVAGAAGRAADAPIIDLLNRLLVDAPNVDLWLDLEEPVRRVWSARKRSERLLTTGVVAGLLLVIAGSIIWLTGYRPGGDGDGPASNAALTTPTPDSESQPTPTEPRASFAAAPTLTPPAETLISVQDLHLMRAIEDISNGRDALEIYDPVANTSTPFLAAGGASRVSPDGSWIVAERRLSSSPSTSLLSGGSVDGSASWELTLSSPSAFVVGNDKVFVVNREHREAYQIQVIELATGDVVDAWVVSEESADPLSARSTRLFLSPDTRRLTLVTTRVDLDADSWTRTLTIYQPNTGDVLEVINEDDRRGDETSFSVRNARQIAGENALYSLVEDEWSSIVRLQFLDLDSGEITGMVLPLQARSAAEADRRGESELHVVPSNTGAIFYVIQSRQRRVAVVDIRSRSLMGTFPMTAADADRSLFETNLNHVSYLEARISPDGKRLYMAVNRERNPTFNSYPIESPVWVVSTTTWEVVGRWTVSGLPRSMAMSGDGDRVYVRSVNPDGSLYLTAFDATSGDVVDVWDTVASPEWADIQLVASLSDLYHSQYGFRPRSGSVVPRDNPALSVLPGVLVEAEGAVAGADSVVTARIVDPVSGEPVTTGGMLRFDPNATLAIELTNGDQQSILVPSSVEPGVYQGRVRLNHAGIWDARVTVINPDGATWAVSQRAAIVVTDGLQAADGGAYRFLVRPANPVNRRTITLRIWMVESQSGERLPEEIEFLDRISDDARIILTHPNGERVEEPMVRLDHASFLSWVRLGEPGIWTAEIILSLETGERISIAAGTVEIHDLTEPYRRPSSSAGGDGASIGGGRMANPASQ
ncbi:hypothetical protein BH23CHL2_BH23CHL2_00850 [soil metagenome]